MTGDRRSLAKTPAPPNDSKLVELLAKYKQQLESSESNKLKLPKLSPRQEAYAATLPTSDAQWTSLPEVGCVTSSAQERGKSGNKSKVGEVPRSLTAFPGAVNIRSRDYRKL